MSDNIWTPLPCPFCGSKAEIQWESTQGLVSCTNEECYATSTWYSSDDASEVTEYIVPRWNRRATPAPTPPLTMPDEVWQTIKGLLEAACAGRESVIRVRRDFGLHFRNEQSALDEYRAALAWLEAQQPTKEGTE